MSANRANNELTNGLRVYEERGRKLATPEIRTPYEVRALGAHALATEEGTGANVDCPGYVRGQALTNAGDGLLHLAYVVGIESGAFPLIIFMGVGALTDFGPLLANPKTLFLPSLRA